MIRPLAFCCSTLPMNYFGTVLLREQGIGEESPVTLITFGPGAPSLALGIGQALSHPAKTIMRSRHLRIIALRQIRLAALTPRRKVSVWNLDCGGWRLLSL